MVNDSAVSATSAASTGYSLTRGSVIKDQSRSHVGCERNGASIARRVVMVARYAFELRISSA